MALGSLLGVLSFLTFGNVEGTQLQERSVLSSVNNNADKCNGTNVGDDCVSFSNNYTDTCCIDSLLICQDQKCKECLPAANEWCQEGKDDKPCCVGLTCFAHGCVPCSGNGYKCGDDLADCCPGLPCFSSICTACTAENHTCGDAFYDCCGDFVCFNSACTACTAEYDTCGDDLADCCPGLTCYISMCLVCTAENDICSNDLAACCSNLVCSSSGVCTNGALSQLDMKFRIKHLMGFAALMNIVYTML